MAKITDVSRWRTEIELAEGFRDDEFGKFSAKEITKTGENIEYFEKGYSTGRFHVPDEGNEHSATTLNFFHVITKLIVPTLFFQNPRVLTLPKRKIDEDASPYAREIQNYFYKELEVDFENELAVWDGYVLNRGITKIGYATRFGMDIPDKTAKKKTSTIDKALESIGLKKKGKEEPIIKEEINQKIVSEKPYIKWVSPFRFLMDPRARTIDEAMWVAEEFDKTVASLKKNPNYKNTGKLVGSDPNAETASDIHAKIPETQIEEFSIVRVYEVHYRNENEMYRLVIAKDGEVFKELYHEKSMYKMEGFQYEMLEFNKHGHLQFRRSDLTKVKNLQDRITSTIDAMMEQLDRFVPKIAVDENKITKNGRIALTDGDVGAVVDFNTLDNAIQEIGLTQFKTDLKALVEEFTNLITIMTGITKAKLLGVSSGETATGENIAQGGENIRLAEMSKTIQRFANRQAEKLWAVVKQFVDLEQLQLITGESGINPQTGVPVYTWLEDIDSIMSQKLQEGEFRFDIEVGSTQKMDTTVLTKRIENLISILARTDVIALMQQQGKKVDVAEVLRLWLQNNPEIVRDTSRIIQDVTDQSQGLLPAQEILLGGAGGQTAGSNLNAQRAQEAEPPVTPDQLLQG